MELNAETIKKALECCYDNDKSCLTCPFQSAYTPCVNLNKNALALIKELTSALTKKETEYNELYELTEDLRKENERLRGIGTPDDKAYIRLSDAKNAIMDYIGEQTVSKYASEAECKSARSGAEGAMNELDYITPVKVAPIAETVREMSEMLKDYLDDYYHLSEDALLDVPDMIDLIAKEMLEGNNEED